MGRSPWFQKTVYVEKVWWFQTRGRTDRQNFPFTYIDYFIHIYISIISLCVFYFHIVSFGCVLIFEIIFIILKWLDWTNLKTLNFFDIFFSFICSSESVSFGLSLSLFLSFPSLYTSSISIFLLFFVSVLRGNPIGSYLEAKNKKANELWLGQPLVWLTYLEKKSVKLSIFFDIIKSIMIQTYINFNL